MKAVAYRQSLPIDDPHSLLDVVLPDPPAPTGRDLLVRVQAVSVNPVDTKIRRNVDPAGADKVKVPRMGHFTQNGAAVQTFAIKRASETFTELRRRWLAADPKRGAAGLALIGHQANLRMLESVARRCEVSPERHLFNVDRRGNTGASGAPSVLSERWDQPPPDAIALAVVGSGLTWAGVLLER